MIKKKTGEIKPCTNCGQEYEHYMTNRFSLCAPCRKEHYKKINRLSEDEYKKPYPLSALEKKRRYTKIKKDLEKALHREEWRAIFQRELEYMQETGIMLWCTDLRESKKKSIQEPGSAKRGRKKIEVKYPDTRGQYE